MNKLWRMTFCASIAIAFAMAAQGPASALSMKECSAKYKAAGKAGTLKGMKWNDFRKKECGSTAAAEKPKKEKMQKKTEKMEKPKMAKSSKLVFPNKIEPKYSKESAGKARLKTCVDQYNANKAANANGGMKWIEKGGGYWSACDKHLKG